MEELVKDFINLIAPLIIAMSIILVVCLYLITSAIGDIKINTSIIEEYLRRIEASTRKSYVANRLYFKVKYNLDLDKFVENYYAESLKQHINEGRNNDET